jgi:hypothetical protein
MTVIGRLAHGKKEQKSENFIDDKERLNSLFEFICDEISKTKSPMECKLCINLCMISDNMFADLL